MDIKFSLFDKDNKIFLKDSLPPFDWCGLFGRNGKIPTTLAWKVIIKGFGKYLKSYMNCPIKKNITLNRMNGDPKMLLFIPNGRGLFQLFTTIIDDKGQKEFVNISLIVNVFDI